MTITYSYWRNVVSVLSGSAIAQLIPILGSLVLARLYAPSEFGVYSAWLGIVMILATILTCRFEMALAIVADGKPRNVAMLATLSTALLMSIFSMLVLSITATYFSAYFSEFSFLLIFLFVPASLFLAMCQSWQSWAAAEGRFRALSMMRISQAGSLTAMQIGIAFVTPSADTLALSHFFGLVAGLFFSVYLMPVKFLKLTELSIEVRKFWKEQVRFPLFSLPADAINASSAQLPLLIVASKFGPEVTGLLAMTMRVLGAPIGLLGKSVLDVFKRHAAENYRLRGECKREYVGTFIVLALGSIAFSLVMFFYSEVLFELFFGEDWVMSGTIAVWLLPLFAMRFVASPLSYMVYIAGKQHIDLYWQIALFFMTITFLSVFSSFKLALQMYSFGYALLYVVYLLMSYRFSRGVAK